MLQRGALWGVGSYLEIKKKLNNSVVQSLLPFLDSGDSVKRGYAARALLNMDKKNIKLFKTNLLSDKNFIPVFDGWQLKSIKISEFINNNTK